MGCGSSMGGSSKKDQYQNLRILGQGASCFVLAVKEKSSGREYAMKQLQKRDGSGKFLPDNKILWETEKKILEVVAHDNILEMVEAYEEKTTYNILTVLYNGGELFDRIKDVFQEDGKFTEKRAALLAHEMLQALAYCHSVSVIHRDLKPENFVFETADAKSRMKLIDFGCARIVRDDEVVEDVAGSPYYVAPELLDAELVRTGLTWKASDMWSIGVIIYLLVCGQPPFNGKSHSKIFKAIKKGAFSFPPNISLSAEVKDLITKLLDMDLDSRLDATQAMAHPWIMNRDTASDQALPAVVVQKLAAFQSQCKLKKAVGRVLVDRMTDEDKKKLGEIFRKFDTDQDGTLGPEEIAKMMAYIGKGEDKQDVARMLQVLDEDGDGQISQTEFATAHYVTRLADSAEEHKRTFAMFDQDGDGFVTHDEIAQVCNFLSPEKVSELITDVDKNGDGKVNLDEWIRAMKDMDTTAMGQ